MPPAKKQYKKRTYKKKTTSKPKPTAKFTQLVHKVLKDEEPLKYCRYFVERPDAGKNLGTMTAFTSAITSTAELYSCLPRIGNGPYSYTRLGNQIEPVSLRVTGQVMLGDDEAIRANDITVHMFFLEAKSVKTLPSYPQVPITSLFMTGQGGVKDFDGSAYVADWRINTNDFKIFHHKQIRMRKAYGYANTTTASPGNGTGSGIPGHGRNEGHSTAEEQSDNYCRFSVKIPCPKKLTYEKDSSVYPVNFAPLLCIGWTRNSLQGTLEAPTDVNVCWVQAQCHLLYKNLT